MTEKRGKKKVEYITPTTETKSGVKSIKFVEYKKKGNFANAI